MKGPTTICTELFEQKCLIFSARGRRKLHKAAEQLNLSVGDIAFGLSQIKSDENSLGFISKNWNFNYYIYKRPVVIRKTWKHQAPFQIETHKKFRLRQNDCLLFTVKRVKIACCH